jgi:hypothetical protein
MQNSRLAKKFGLIVTLAVFATILTTLIVSQVTADVRPPVDQEITAQTVIIVPNHDSYRVAIDNVNRGTQRAPFGSFPGGGGGPPVTLCSLQHTVNSGWPLNTQIRLIKNFRLPAGAENLRVLLSVDNDVRVFLNGRNISGGLVTHDGCPIVDEFKFDAPNSALRVGNNALVVRGIDRGGTSYLDLRVLVDIPP